MSLVSLCNYLGLISMFEYVEKVDLVREFIEPAERKAENTVRLSLWDGLFRMKISSYCIKIQCNECVANQHI